MFRGGRRKNGDAHGTYYFCERLMALRAVTEHENYQFCSAVSASRHFAHGSRLLLRLKQAQLFEAFSGPCPIAIAQMR
jgi:hypothetical protein